ncbi:feruloyl CoA ortho-hydroxylase 1-like [Brassica napus]|uniref:Non-haem dioxygenase N-terminal domain-containing protein n=1 Tax=Brassica oleracea var. oleracea TaxID=109376 RepID=A0A0D3CKJ3_BRAOL|nr:PREDICTED: feruloyl CoA ortho-hydroxylase 1-like [Brassica oleracea var. oleracea]XP_048613552.1 feruloyl CoA ortho-hydroxylase 1-like [Brassica napus]
MVPTLSTAQFADPAEATRLKALPDQYIQPFEERLLNKFVNDEAIPVINMLNPEQNKYAEAICDAAEKWGFFQVINYGVDLDVLDNVKAATHWFFNLPFEEMSRLTKENSLSTNVRFGMSFSPRAEKDYLSLFFVSESEQFC